MMKFWSFRWKCWSWEGCKRSIQCNANCEYQLRTCSWNEENHGKLWSSWLVPLTVGCILTSRQKSGIQMHEI